MLIEYLIMYIISSKLYYYHCFLLYFQLNHDLFVSCISLVISFTISLNLEFLNVYIYIYKDQTILNIIL